MKPKIIRKKDEVRISTESQVVVTWDSSVFDEISPKLLQKNFTDAYKEHTEFLVKLVTSRAALDTAMINVDSSVTEHMNGSVAIHEDTTVEAIDLAFSVALKMYAYEKAFSFLDEATRKEVLLGLITNRQSSSPLVAPKKGNSGGQPIGHLGSQLGVNSMADIKKGIENIERRFADKLGDQPDSPFGDMPERKPKNKVGLVRRSKS